MIRDPPALGAAWFCRILGQCHGEPGGFELENVAIYMCCMAEVCEKQQ